MGQVWRVSQQIGLLSRELALHYAEMGGTDSEEHKLAMYLTSFGSRKWPRHLIFDLHLSAI